MANDTKKFTVQFDINGSNAVTGLKSIEQETGKVITEMEDLERASKQASAAYIDSVKQYSSVLGNLQGKLENIYNHPKLNDALKLNSASTTLANYIKQLKELEQAQDKVAKAAGDTENVRLNRIANSAWFKAKKAFAANNVADGTDSYRAKQIAEEKELQEFHARALINRTYVAEQNAATASKEQAESAKAYAAYEKELADKRALQAKQLADQKAFQELAERNHVRTFLANKFNTVDESAEFHAARNANLSKFTEDTATNAHKQYEKDILDLLKQQEKELKEVTKAEKEASKEAANRAAKEQANREQMERQRAIYQRQYGYAYDNNLATGSKTFNSARFAASQYNPQADRERVDRQHEYENAIKEKGNNSFEAQNLKYQRDRAALAEQHGAAVTQNAFRVNAGEITPDIGRHLDLKALQEYQKGLSALHEPLALSAKDTESLFFRVGRAIGAYQIWNVAIGAVGSAMHSIIPIGIQLESTVASLTSTIGSDAGASVYLHKLTEEAKRTGITLTTLRENFRNFQASTSLAGASLESTWKMFSNLNTVITALHSTSEQAQGIFNAMAQIFNKSKVQSEELVKQLGNLLPGAFASMAASMKIAPSELSAQMKKGMVLAEDVMENFTEYMKNRFVQGFAIAAHSTNAEIGRMQTAWQLLGESIYKANKGPIVETIRGLTSLGNYLVDATNGTNNFGKTMETAGHVIESVLIVNLVLAVPKLVAMGAAMLRIVGLLNPWVAGITAVGAAYLALKDHQDAPMALHEKIAAEKKDAAKKKAVEDTSIAPEIRVTKTDEYIAYQDRIKQIEQNIKDSTTAGRMGSMQGVYKTDLKDTKESLKAYMETQIAAIKVHDKELFDLQAAALHNTVTPEMDNVVEKYDEQHADTLEKSMGAARHRVRDSWNKSKVGQDFKKVADNANSLDPDRWPSPEDVLKQKHAEQVVKEDEERAAQEAKITFLNKHKDKGVAAAAKKAESADYLESSGAFQESRELITQQLQLTESRYSKHLISLNEYLTKKQELQAKDAIATEQYLQEQTAKANKYADPQVRQRTLNQVAKERNTIGFRREMDVDSGAVESRRFKEDLEALEEEVNAIKGGQPNSKGRYLKQQESNLTRLNREIEDDKSPFKSNAQQQKNAIFFNATARGAGDSLSGINEKESVNRAKYESSLEQIKKEESLGQLGPISSAMRLNALQQQYLKILKETLDLKKAIAKANPDNKVVQEEVSKAEEAVTKFKTDVTPITGQISTAFGNALVTPMANMVTGAANARQGFRSFAIGVEQDIGNIVAQELRSVIMKGLANVGEAALKGLSGLFRGTDAQVADAQVADALGNVTSQGMYANNAIGGVYTSPSLSAYSNQIVTSPTMFKFASGAGLMGEAGPEGILPLTRDSSNRLAVHTVGANEAATNPGAGVNIGAMHIHLQASDNMSSTEHAALISKAIRTQLTTLIQQQTATNLKPGNILNRTGMSASI